MRRSSARRFIRELLLGRLAKPTSCPCIWRFVRYWKMAFAFEERRFPHIEMQMAAPAKTNIILPSMGAQHVASPASAAVIRLPVLSLGAVARTIVLSASKRLV